MKEGEKSKRDRKEEIISSKRKKRNERKIWIEGNII